MAFLDALKGTLSDITNKVNSASGSLSNAYSNSAMQMQMDLANQTNAFNAAQAALNRQFQQTSAERSMDVSSIEAEKARQFSAEQAELNRKFQKELSDTAYQRAYSDLKKAGLNPMLLYTSMGGASTPSGSTASSFAGSGSSASGSSASGVMADISSAKRADLSLIDNLLPLLAIEGITSALSNFSLNKTVDKVVEKVTPKMTYTDENGKEVSFNWKGYQSTEAKKMFDSYNKKNSSVSGKSRSGNSSYSRMSF